MLCYAAMLQTTYKLQFPYSCLVRFSFLVSPQVLNRTQDGDNYAFLSNFMCIYPNAIPSCYFFFDWISDQRKPNRQALPMLHF